MINRDIDGDCPEHELERKGLNSEKKARKKGRNILEDFDPPSKIFWKEGRNILSKFRLSNGYFSEIRKTAILTEKAEKNRTTANLVKNSHTRTRKNEASYRDSERDSGKGGFGGEELYPPVPRIWSDNNVISRKTQAEAWSPRD